MPRFSPPPDDPMLFPDAFSIVRINPALNDWRYNRAAVWPDLFGRALLKRHWGRIGAQGRRRLDT